MWNAVGVTLNGDGCREARESDRSVELRERVVHRLVGPVAGEIETADRNQDDQSDEREQNAADDPAATRLTRGLLGSERLIGDNVGVRKVGKAHVLMASVNGAG